MRTAATPSLATADICEVCRWPITDVARGSLFLNAYAHDRHTNPTAIVAHDACVPDGPTYEVALDRIQREESYRPGDDSLLGWRSHLAAKVWWCVEYDEALDRAYLATLAIKARAAGRPLSGKTQQRVEARVRRKRDAVPAKLRAAVLERDAFTCRRCGAKAPDARLEVDHIRPVSRGGRTEIANLQALCQLCNAGKSDNVPTDHDLAATEIRN